jgi:hypothetical protein
MAQKNPMLNFQNPYEPGKYEGLGVFRDVPGRILNPELTAAPVKVMNNDEYAMNQSSLTLGVANTEYNIQGIPTLASIIVKARGGDAKLSIYEGQSGNNYTLIKDGSSFEVSAVPFGQVSKPVAFFVQSTTAGMVVEIIGMRLF